MGVSYKKLFKLLIDRDLKKKDLQEMIDETFTPATGITMTMETTLPGVQFYSGNFMQGHAKRSGFCLEPQTFPDAVNQPAFGQDVILRPGQVRRDAIRWRFSL